MVIQTADAMIGKDVTNAEISKVGDVVEVIAAAVATIVTTSSPMSPPRKRAPTPLPSESR